jgi:hypothetical protein
MDFGTVASGPDHDKDGTPTHTLKLKAFLDVLNVTRPSVSAVGDLVNFVNLDPSVADPIGDLYIGAHSTEEGSVEIQMTKEQQHEPNQKSRFLSDYETIEDTLDPDPNVNIGSIVIDDSTVGPDPTTHSVHFKGCNLGQAVPLLQKWKEAFGNKIQLSAPKYTHGLVVDNGERGLWEYLQYQFVVLSKDPVVDRSSLIQLFQTQQLRFLEVLNNGALTPGPIVPDENWDAWLPQALDMTNTAQSVIANQTQAQWRYFDVQPLASPRGTVQINEEFSAVEQPFPRPIIYPAGQPLPTDPDVQIADLKNNLLADQVNTKLGRVSRFSSSHPFPVYQRWGYESIDDFRDGFVWTFTPSKKNPRQLNARGTRQRYTILIGVTDPNPGLVTTQNELLTNFHPFSSVFLPGMQLPTDDARFFKIV